MTKRLSISAALVAGLYACAPKESANSLADDAGTQATPDKAASAPSGNSLQGKALWFNPNASSATHGMSNMASQPTAVWVLSDIGAVAGAVQAAGSGQFPVFVAYNIPGRDCGNHSAGGTSDSGAYRGWVESFAGAIGSGNAVVIIEPDALSLDCMPEAPELISFAVTRFKSNPNTFVYIDAGHAQFPELSTIIDRLNRANIKAADGFALNVSNFYSDGELIQRANQINAGLEPQIGRKAHYVIDTSRNGNGSNGEWCNPTGRALGRKPTTQTGEPLMDAALWIKTPGESDGSCSGGPPRRPVVRPDGKRAERRAAQGWTRPGSLRDARATAAPRTCSTGAGPSQPGRQQLGLGRLQGSQPRRSHLPGHRHQRRPNDLQMGPDLGVPERLREIRQIRMLTRRRRSSHTLIIQSG